MQTVPAVLSALRNETSKLHREVEQLVPFFDKNFDQERFVEWLLMMYPFYKKLDNQINSQDFLNSIGWDYVPRSALIVEDLLMLEADLPSLNDFTSELLQNLDTTYKRLGGLYVVEGSSLGGQIIYKALSRSVPMLSQHGSAFLSPYGDETMVRWNQFIECLRSVDSGQEANSEVIEGASLTFLAMSAWIREHWHERPIA